MLVMDSAEEESDEVEVEPMKLQSDPKRLTDSNSNNIPVTET